VTSRVYVGASSSRPNTQAQVQVDLTKSLKIQTTVGTEAARCRARPQNDRAAASDELSVRILTANMAANAEATQGTFSAILAFCGQGDTHAKQSFESSCGVGQSVWAGLHPSRPVREWPAQSADHAGFADGMTSNPAISRRLLHRAMPRQRDSFPERAWPGCVVSMSSSASRMWAALPMNFAVYSMPARRRRLCEPGGQSAPGERYEGTVIEARRLWAALNRPNVFIKVRVPRRPRGYRATHQRGHQHQCDAAVRTGRVSGSHRRLHRRLEKRAAKGFADQVGCIGRQLFISRSMRWSTRCSMRWSPRAMRVRAAKSLRGEVAIASAKLAYQMYRHVFAHDRFMPSKPRVRSSSACYGQHERQDPSTAT